MMPATEMLLDVALASYLARHGTPLMGVIIGGLILIGRVMGY